MFEKGLQAWLVWICILILEYFDMSFCLYRSVVVHQTSSVPNATKEILELKDHLITVERKVGSSFREDIQFTNF